MPGVGGCKFNFNLISDFQFHACLKAHSAWAQFTAPAISYYRFIGRMNNDTQRNG